MLLEEFLRPLGLQQQTADTAIGLERRFKMPARFWLQVDYDLQTALNEA